MSLTHLKYVFSNKKETIVEISCCVCKKMKIGDNWVVKDPKTPHKISHGYCPVCLVEAKRKLKLHDKTYVPITVNCSDDCDC